MEQKRNKVFMSWCGKNSRITFNERKVTLTDMGGQKHTLVRGPRVKLRLPQRLHGARGGAWG